MLSASADSETRLDRVRRMNGIRATWGKWVPNWRAEDLMNPVQGFVRIECGSGGPAAPFLRSSTEWESRKWQSGGKSWPINEKGLGA